MLLFVKWKDKFKIDSNFVKDFLEKVDQKEFKNKNLFFLKMINEKFISHLFEMPRKPMVLS